MIVMNMEGFRWMIVIYLCFWIKEKSLTLGFPLTAAQQSGAEAEEENDSSDTREILLIGKKVEMSSNGRTGYYAITNDCSPDNLKMTTTGEGSELIIPQWAIDLDTRYHIRKIILKTFNSKSYYYRVFSNIFIFVKDGDTFPNLTLHFKKYSFENSCALSESTEAQRKNITLNCTDSGRYVIIRKNEQESLSFCGIKIFGVKAYTEIGLIDKDIRMTGNEGTRFNAITNDCSLDPNKLTDTFTIRTKNAGWTIDLAGRYRIEKIMVELLKYLNDFRNIYVFVKDGDTFPDMNREDDSFDNYCAYYDATPPTKKKINITFDCTHTGRYVSIHRKGGKKSYVQFCGIKIFGVKAVPINGNWSDWTGWGNCSRPCRNGIQTRTRSCVWPAPRDGGKECKGNSSQSKSCPDTMPPCPTNGNWSEWTTLSDCSQTCGPAVRTRTRFCNNPKPQHGGKPCTGNDSQPMKCPDRPRCPNPCTQLNLTKSGVQNVTIGSKSISVFCEIDEMEKAWIIVQRRTNGSLTFDKTWREYKNGFGNLEGEFWIGNDNLFLLTGRNIRKVRFDLGDDEGGYTYAEYESFSVSDEKAYYRLRISGHSGPCANEMAYHNDMYFSTKDQDHDKWSINSCSEVNGNAGWWFRICSHVNLNHEYDGIFWHGVGDITKSVIKIS